MLGTCSSFSASFIAFAWQVPKIWAKAREIKKRGTYEDWLNYNSTEKPISESAQKLIHSCYTSVLAFQQVLSRLNLYSLQSILSKETSSIVWFLHSAFNDCQNLLAGFFPTRFRVNSFLEYTNWYAFAFTRIYQVNAEMRALNAAKEGKSWKLLFWSPFRENEWL